MEVPYGHLLWRLQCLAEEERNTLEDGIFVLIGDSHIHDYLQHHQLVGHRLQSPMAAQPIRSSGGRR